MNDETELRVKLLAKQIQQIGKELQGYSKGKERDDSNRFVISDKSFYLGVKCLHCSSKKTWHEGFNSICRACGKTFVSTPKYKIEVSEVQKE